LIKPQKQKRGSFC